jgi:formylglycine-generating enzyme required for sulfatase activity
MVTLTKGFYMAEHPVTEEMFQAVVGGKPGKEKTSKAAANVSCAGMYEFCRAVSQNNGRKVRVPTAAEWEYAARVGTSNPTFREKYSYLDSTSPRPLPVKSKAPNAWGFYDLVSNGWERVSDSSDQLDHQDMVDPQHMPAEDQGTADRTKKHRHFGKGNGAYAISEVEYIDSEIAPEKSYPGLIRSRVVVEAEPTAAREKH